MGAEPDRSILGWLRVLELAEKGMYAAGLGEEDLRLYTMQMVVQTLRVVAGEPDGSTRGFMGLVMDLVEEYGDVTGKKLVEGIRSAQAVEDGKARVEREAKGDVGVG